MGLSPGGADIYTAQLERQWVDITGLDPGRVVVRGEANPLHCVLESNSANNDTQVTREIPGVRFEVMRGLGHTPMWDDAGRIAKLIGDFAAAAARSTNGQAASVTGAGASTDSAAG